MYIGMYVYVLYIFLNLIMSIIPTLYFFVEFLSETKYNLRELLARLPQKKYTIIINC